MADANQPVLKSRRALPSGRAVLGALLITLAALGVLLASQLGEDATFQDVVVARNDLAPGTVLSEADVASIRLRLDEQADWVVGDVNDVVGNVILGPVGQLEFVQRSNLAEGTPEAAPSGLAEVSIEIRRERAPSSIVPGEEVSILATFDDVTPEQTELIADRVVVLSFQNQSEDFSSSTAVLRLGVADGRVASEIVTAAQTGAISVIGIAGADDVVLPEVVTR